MVRASKQSRFPHLVNIPQMPNVYIPDVGNVDNLSKEEQESKRFNDDSNHRNHLVVWMMWVVSLWLIIVIVVVILNNPLNLQIPTSTLNVLLATTTLNVLGLANIILKGLFGGSKTSIFRKRR